jgi:hypothetical protein
VPEGRDLSHAGVSRRNAQVIDRTGLRKTKLYELQSDGLFPIAHQNHGARRGVD